jgi:RsmE family RNA methyltransferase
MMGVRRIDLVRANRVERSYYQSPLLQPENYRPFLIEGMSQGKLTRMPAVTIHQRFRPFFEDVLPARERDGHRPDLKLLPDLDCEGRTILSTWKKDALRLLIALGPEGGWVPFEIELMQQRGFQPVSLGRWVLRVEHALTAVLSQIELLRANEAEK